MATMAVFAQVVLVGVVATLVMDAWSVLLRSMGAKTLDYALVGRWIGHWRHGRWVHRPIQHSATIAHERGLGWLAHYALGVGFAALLVALAGAGWLQRPSLLPALLFGLCTVVLPWCVMQPAFGAGFAASLAPQPWRARRQSIATHTVFGLGLFVGGCINRGLMAALSMG